MKSKSTLVFVMVVLFLVIQWTCESAFSSYLYGTEAGGTTLFQIDSSNGNSSVVGATAWQIDGLAYVPETATLLLLGLGLLLTRRR